MSNQYKQAGVDIEAGYQAVSRIKRHVARTTIPGVVGNLGGFGGLFDLNASGKYREPILVSGTDGVGTKLVLAQTAGIHDTIGIDAVAMCANDILTVGARPLFFLDYIACGKLNPDTMEAIVAGVAEGCVQAGCALIGGEMAEHPGVMPDEEYDIAGFCVGVVEKSEMITGETIQAGDLLIGLPSSGVHSNGFSLIRKILAENNLWHDKSLIKELLTPTRIYTEEVKSLKAKGMAHITGGGFIENIPRILPKGLGAKISRGTWHIHEIFNFIQSKGNIPEEEMYNLYNMGIGMVVAVSPEDIPQGATVIGQVLQGEGVIL
ncbi:MAG: phosphoribosylformylglycinamidine cyclo-ligase [Defluviitaleaceae bacterium]|nr:phosphoribosylformylglycinamidine cyclo-ligase [Defluviitaleaceae bacterium]